MAVDDVRQGGDEDSFSSDSSDSEPQLEGGRKLGLQQNANDQLESRLPPARLRSALGPAPLSWPAPRRWGPGGSPWRLRRLDGTNRTARRATLMPRVKAAEDAATPAFQFTATVPVPPPRHETAMKSETREALAKRNLRSVRSVVHLKTCSVISRAPELEELAQVIRHELSLCKCLREVQHAASIAAKVIRAPRCEMLSLSGRVACKLRQAIDTLRCSSTFSMLEGTQQRLLLKVLEWEVRKRRAELAGWDEAEAEVLAMSVGIDELDKACTQSFVASKKGLNSTTGSSSDKPSKLATVWTSMEQPTLEEPPPVPEEEANSSSTRRSRSQRRLATQDFSGEKLPSLHNTPVQSQGGSPASPALAEVAEAADGKQKRRGSRLEATQMMLEATQLTRIFNKLQDDGKVHHDDMMTALEFVGFRKPEKAWLNDVFREVTKYTGCDLGEFIRIVRGYEERQHQAYRQAFAEVDEDDSGTITVREFGKLLERFWMHPMRHVLEELIREVDETGEGTLDLAEFEGLMGVLRVREGFTKREYDEFMAIYLRFDADASGEIDALELQGILVYLGFSSATENVVQDLLHEYDIANNGAVDQCHFIACMRKVREIELEEIRATMARHDVDGSGTINLEELEEVLRSLGYYPDVDIIREVVAEVGQDPDEPELDLSEVWQFLTIYRSREGLSLREAEDVREVFDEVASKHAKVGRGSTVQIDTLRVGQVLAWLGWCVPLEVHQSFVAKVDVDASGQLSFDEVCKLVRLLLAREIQRLREVFLESVDDIAAVLTEEAASALLEEVECVDASGKAPTIAPEDFSPMIGGHGVAFAGLVRTMVRCKRQARRSTRDTWGFSAQEVLELKLAFGEYKTSDSQSVDGHRLTSLIEDRFPGMANRADLRPVVRDAILECDSEKKGRLNFTDFLKLMDYLRRLQMEEKLKKERSAVQETKFNVRDVEEFRDLFVSAGPAANDQITAHAFQAMLSKVCPLGDKNRQELASICKRVTGRLFHGHHASRATLDFPEFLRILKALLDADFTQIHERSLQHLKL
mmetsp:Transcript_46260/g.107578  ORF Transcript_46260/g.107578 Transcript_46260/m.107578 type:complete len:1040 (+) Transcript_46260:138-3257(+)